MKPIIYILATLLMSTSATAWENWDQKNTDWNAWKSGGDLLSADPMLELESNYLMKLAQDEDQGKYKNAMWLKDNPEVPCEEAEWSDVQAWCELHRQNLSRIKSLRKHQPGQWKQWKYR